MASQEQSKEKKWYIVQVYAGKEKSVRDNIISRIKMLNMQDQIFQALVPEETIIVESKDAKTGEIVRKEKKQKMYPGYVFVEMIDNKNSWYVVRNTPEARGILGSYGDNSRPTPVPDEQMEPVLRACNITREAEINFQVGDVVTITGGNFKDQTGKVISIDLENKECTVELEVFGRPLEVPIELNNVESIK
ncbi:MAG: transcription termination/antitermination protein NusG [Gammaproteobacteria bacterium]|nr:transcription termination/antitermination protein NusG [Gammaproteobacteria bacterium]